MTTPTQPPTHHTETHGRLLAAAPVTERRVDAAGVSTAVYEGGHGPPMILLHGQGEFWAVWLNVLDDLVATHRVVVVDLPGHGGSRPGDATLDAATLVRWLDEVIDATCDEPPVLVGHLLGGGIALRHAVEHSDRIRHLVLVDSLGLAWFRPAPSFAIPMIRFMARPTAESRDRLFDKCFVDFDRTGQKYGDSWEDLREHALQLAQGDELDAALKAMMPRVGMPPVAARDRDRITAPTTLVHGRHDLQVQLAAAERAARRHGWPLHIIEDCRDDPAAEQPEVFLRVLHDVLDDTDTNDTHDTSARQQHTRRTTP